MDPASAPEMIDLNINCQADILKFKSCDVFLQTLPTQCVASIDVSLTTSKKFKHYKADVSVNRDFEAFKDKLDRNELNQDVWFPRENVPDFTNESSSRRAFYANVLLPMKEIFKGKLTVDDNFEWIGTFKPDYTLKNVQKEIFVVIEVKQWNAFLNVNQPENPTKEQVVSALQTGGTVSHQYIKESRPFRKSIEQLQAYLFEMNKATAFGILTSYFHTYFVILSRGETRTLQISPVVRYCESPLEKIAHFIKLAMGTQSEAIRAKKMISPVKAGADPIQERRMTTRSWKLKRDEGKQLEEDPKPQADGEQHGSKKRQATACEYEMGAIVAEGRSGPVREIFDHLGHTYLAKSVGECKRKKYTETEIAHELENEKAIYDILRDLQGNVIPQLHFCGYLDGCIFTLVIEKISDAVPVSKRNHLSPEEKDAIVNSLNLIHKKGILHNDISEDNILIGKDNRVHFIDFALSTVCKFEGAFIKEMRKLQALLQTK